MMERIQLFLRGMATNRLGRTGVVVATSAFLLFALFELLRLVGLLHSAFVSLVAYMILPAALVAGLLLIVIGWWHLRRTSGRPSAELMAERFPTHMLTGGPLMSSLFGTGLGLTVLCLLLLGVGGAHMFHFMEEPRFCGTACHHIMTPEWTAYQASPHANVSCVDCHVGEGVGAYVEAKANGLWQVISGSLNLYERPIPTPVHNLRPARETCEQCHWPDRFYGDRIRNIERFAFDEASTPQFTTLALKVGSGKGDARGEIHWHIAAENEIRYQPANEDRDAIEWVEVRRGGDFWRYENRALAKSADHGEAAPAMRTMDCVDCHNRATHIFQDPEDAVDAMMATGQLSRKPPFAKREYFKALTGNWGEHTNAADGIANTLRRAWRATPGLSIGGDEIEGAIATLTECYERNIHSQMKVGWNTYATHIGHRGGGGCLRCHNRDMVDEQGRAVPYDCTLCHSILAHESESPFRFLQPIDEMDPLRKMHRSLQEEFTGVPLPPAEAMPEPAEDGLLQP